MFYIQFSKRSGMELLYLKFGIKGTILKIPNWKGITVLSIPSKIMAKIVIQRFSEAIDSTLREEQAGFCKGRGCSDKNYKLGNIIEQCTEWQRQLYINFIDFEKAFDSIHIISLWKIARSYGIQ